MNKIKQSIYPFKPETEFEIEERSFIVEMLSSEDDLSCSIAQARVKPGVATALHSLKGTIERYILLEGEGEVVVGSQAPQRVGVKGVVCISADEPQSIRNLSEQDDLVFLCICTPGFKPEAYVHLEGEPA